MRALTVSVLVGVQACSASMSKPVAAYDPGPLDPITFSPEGEVDLQGGCRVVSPPKASSPVHLALTLGERATHAHFKVTPDSNVVVVPQLVLADCDNGLEGRLQLNVFEDGRQIDRIVDETAMRNGPWKSADDIADWAIARLRASQRVGQALGAER